jgi:uncharacterized protein (TIGR02611 family)
LSNRPAHDGYSGRSPRIFRTVERPLIYSLLIAASGHRLILADMHERDTLEQDIDRWQNEGGLVSGDRRPGLAAGSARSSRLRRALRVSRKIVVAAAGGGVLVLGVALIVLPGPAIVVIPLGLGLLATEFRWAARLLRWLKERAHHVVERGRRALPARSPT